ncbi:MAG: hypothetical protein ACTS5F_01920 [Candidatus Hodgkinia cicadicola]
MFPLLPLPVPASVSPIKHISIRFVKVPFLRRTLTIKIISIKPI